MAHVEQLGDDSLYAVCAACYHMALVFAIRHLYETYCFCPFLFLFFLH